MDYPPAILFPDWDMRGSIRLQVGALCTCLDGGSYEGKDFVTSETAPFTQEHKYDGKSFDVWARAHAFWNIKPTGNLDRAVKKVLSAVFDSISRGQLKPVQLRMNLDGQIDSTDTWVLMNDFEDWCDSRNLTLEENWSQYLQDETTIFDNALDAADSTRRKLETLDFDKQVRNRSEDIASLSTEEELRAYSLKLLEENVALRYGANGAREVERPMTNRERRSLLTIIAALCKEAKYDYERHSKTAGLIQRACETMGLAIGETTIEQHLKRIPDAIRPRLK